MTYLFSNASNATIINEVEVKNDVGNALPVVGVSGSPLTVTFGGATVDAFGRLRTASPYTIFDNYFTVDTKPRVWDTIIDTISPNSSYSFEANLSCVAMNVTELNGSKVIRQSKKYCQYQPGKSLLSMNTFVMNEGKPNLRQRVGYFDNRDGIFLERVGNVPYIVKRSFVSGTPVDTRIAQSNWNGDKLEGNGASRLNLDLNKAQIFFTDIEWLGVGSVRTGFIIDGQYHIVHSFHHANIESNVYMTQATLPVRYEIENIGATTGPSTLKQICSTVISEAGYAPAAITRSASTPLTGLPMSETNFRPLIAIKLQDGNVDHVVLPSRLTLFGLQTTPFVYKLIMDANVIGGSWLTTGSDSVVKYNSNATTLGPGGYELLQGMFIGGTYTQPITINLREFNSSYQLRGNIAGYGETFVVAVKATTGNDDALGSLAWEEYA